jgi:hypothetical protein
MFRNNDDYSEGEFEREFLRFLADAFSKEGDDLKKITKVNRTDSKS